MEYELPPPYEINDERPNSVNLYNRILNDRDVPLMRVLCLRAYRRAADTFTDNMLCNIDNKDSIRQFFKHDYDDLKHLNPFVNTDTRDELLYKIMTIDQQNDQSDFNELKSSFQAARYTAIDVLNNKLYKLYKDEILDISLTGHTSEFSKYCVDHFPDIVRSHYCFDGNPVVDANNAFKCLVTKWREN